MTKYKRAGAHNYNDATAWSTTSGGSADTTVPTAADDVVLDANSGNLTLTAAGLAKTFISTGYTAQFIHNGFTITVSGNVLLDPGMTYTPLATSTWIINASSTLTTGGKLMPLIQHTSGLITLGDDLDFMASKVMTLTLSGQLDLNGHVIAGNSTVNRVLIQSSTLGTARTILNSTPSSFENADFMDIAFSSASDLDLSAITGLSGDCGGNTIVGGGALLTLTPGLSDVVTASTSKNTSDATIHSTGRVPLPQDDVSLANWTGGTLTFDMPRIGKSLDATGSSGTRTMAWTSVQLSGFGSVTFVSGMTFSQNQTFNFRGRGSYTLTMAGKTFTNPANLNAPGGTLTLQDPYLGNINSPININNGFFKSNFQPVTASAILSSVTSIRRVDFEGSIVTLLLTSGTGWNFTSTTNLTFHNPPDEIIYAAASASARTFAGGGLTYKKVTYNVPGSTGQLTISGNNHFEEPVAFYDVVNGRTLLITAGSTQRFEGPGSFDEIVGSSGKLMTMKSTIDGTAYNLVNDTGENINTDYLSIRDAHATGGHFYVGANSVNVSNNTGLIFGPAPGPSEGVHIFGDEGLVA